MIRSLFRMNINNDKSTILFAYVGKYAYICSIKSGQQSQLSNKSKIKVMRKINLIGSLDAESFEFVSNAFKFEPTEKGIFGENAYGGNKWVIFFNDGDAVYSHTGTVQDTQHFNSHQDCVDFIRIK